jgi:signal transduction histidine kinase
LEPLQGNPEAISRWMESGSALTHELTARLKTEQPSERSNVSMAFRVLDASGAVIFSSPHHASLPWPDLRAGGQAISHDDMPWRVMTQAGREGTVTLQIAESFAGSNAQLSTVIFRYIIAPLLVFLPIAALMTMWVARRGLAPVRELADTISSRSPDDLKPLGPVRAFVETRPVFDEINSLLTKLQATLDNQRDFLADAAHELRTPLAVIQAQAHVLQTAGTDEDRALAVDELNKGVSRAASLIGKLLITARVSSEEFKPRMQMLDIAAFTQERVAVLSPLAVQKQIEVELNAAPNLLVRVDRETFVSAVDNVIDNAIRYTPAHGHIQIDIDRGAGQVRMRVADDGAGIPAELHERVFERFFRAHTAEQQGSGLGLSIVKRVLALHGGHVALAQGLNSRGLSVVLTLPLGQH